MENIDLLSEDELRLLEAKYKQEWIPSHRLYLLLPYNVLAAGLTMHYTLNFKK